METANNLLKYDALGAATWQAGKPVPYMFLANTFETITEHSARLKIQEILCNTFRTVIATTPGDLLSTVYLRCINLQPKPQTLNPTP